MSDVPVFINSYNRLECLSKQITRFEEMGIANLTIIDNASTYPPLLEYLNELNKKHTVIFLSSNEGSYALWRTDILKSEVYSSSYYVYTDPDIVPIVECPNDVIEYLISVLEKYPRVSKAGLGLRIDNLPDTEMADKAREWEKPYWSERFYLGDGLYRAPIDTTFCVYRPNGKIGHKIGIRTGYPYIAEHLTWYENLDNLSEELQYYRKERRCRWVHWLR